MCESSRSPVARCKQTMGLRRRIQNHGNVHLKCCSFCTCPNAERTSVLNPVCRVANGMLQHWAMAPLRDGKLSGKHCS